MAAFLSLDGLSKRFGDTVAVNDLSLSLERGEMLALLGPSGSGKTTTLRLLAGFEQPERGRVLVAGEDVTHIEPVARRFGMVFQHYALFPHLDVGANVAFGLESLGVRRGELAERVAGALALVDLAGYERRRVPQLSGGQQQRVALARALAPEPRVLLLDEPLSNLDPALRERTRRELRDLIHRLGITTVLVTHEQDDAFDLGDRVAVLRDGRLEQVGTPDELYTWPANPFVARFIGRSSRVDVTVLGAAGLAVRLAFAGVEWMVEVEDGRVPPVGPATMVLRPEALRLGPTDAAAVSGAVVARRFTGSSAFFSVRIDGGVVLEVAGASQAATVGQRVGLVPSRRTGGGIHLFPAGSA